MWLFIAGATTTGQVAASAQLLKQVVRQPVRELRERVRRGGGDQVDLRVGDQRQMAERLVRRGGFSREGAARGVALELAAQHRRPGQRLERGGADEPPARGRLHDAHRMPGGGRQADQLERLVRGDAAAHAEQDSGHGLVLDGPEK